MWIISAPADLLFFSFGWVAFWLAFQAWGHTHQVLLLAVVLSVNFVHRTITHLFVYGDPKIFVERKYSYLILPIFFLVLTVVAIQTSYFVYLIAASGLWNFYHSTMQKVGILRIYSRKSGTGRPWLDRAVVLSWFVFIVLQLPLLSSVRREVISLASSGRLLVVALEPFLGVLGILSKIALTVSVVVTVLYLKEEVSGRSFSVPKNLFLLSIFLLYGTFFFGFLPAFAAFGFSHSIEYLAFTNYFAREKYARPSAPPSFMSAFVRRQGLSVALFAGLLMTLYLAWDRFSTETLLWFIVGSSFLHYLYDGWIWKIRKPSIGAPMGIRYPAPQT